MGKHITDYLLYRWRYKIGYALIALLVIGLLVVAGLYIPGGLSQAEMRSVVTSNAITLSRNAFDPAVVINLPYHLLQRFSIEIFGLSNLSIKLPSLLLGLLSAAGMFILLKTWFRKNVAVLTTIIVITTGQFLFVAQSGTESIVYIFWSIWLLVAAMMVSREVKWGVMWKILLFGIAALSLYTPLSIYILLALISAIILHPHLRYLVKRLSKPKLLFAGFCALIIISPLLYVVWRHQSVGYALLGIPESWPSLQANGLTLLKQYFGFLTPNSGMLMTPIYGLGSVILIGIGVYRLATTKYTARSYITAAWALLLIPVLLINPNFVSITFVPVVLLIAMGISTLLTRWYMLFPRNPYARLAGLVPLAVLIGGMVLSGVDRYMYGYLYSPQTAGNFSNDLRLINHELANKTRGNTTLIVGDQEVAFYNVVKDHHKDISVITRAIAPQPSATTVIVSKAAYIPSKEVAPQAIIADSISNDSDRFYIYKTDKK